MEKLGKAAAESLSLMRHSTAPLAQTIEPILDYAQLPKLFQADIDRELPDRLVGFWRGGRPILRRAMTAEERGKIESRARELDAALMSYREAQKDILASAIVKMLKAFPAMHKHDLRAALQIAQGYLEVVAGEPPWAILAVCHSVRTGVAGCNPAWPPNEPEFAARVRAQTDPYRERLRQVRALLAAEAEQQSDASRRPTYEELRARYDGPHGEPWGLSAADTERRTRTEALRAAEIAANDALIAREWAALGRPPITSNGRPISVALARSLGVLGIDAAQENP